MPTAAVVTRARSSAADALAGRAVSPYELLNVPVLDIAARPARVTWIGPPAQRPELFGPTTPRPLEGLLLGQGPATVVIVTMRDDVTLVVRFPATMVLTETE
jgi:hypothetical protein